jgi:ABC-type transport system involved in multi-copper enzyme maturation permease subunit
MLSAFGALIFGTVKLGLVAMVGGAVLVLGAIFVCALIVQMVAAFVKGVFGLSD